MKTKKNKIKLELTVEIEPSDPKHLKKAIHQAKIDAMSVKTGSSHYRNTPKRIKVISENEKRSV